jgi:hypothetical protein
MSVNLSPVGGAAAQFLDNNGNTLTGGKLYTYEAGTTTPQTTYTTSAGNVAHANPIILDAAGRVPGGEIWLTVGADYKFSLFTSADVLIANWDNIFGIVGKGVVSNATGTGSQTIFAVSSTPSAIYINGVYQNQNTYTVGAGTITFSEAPPLNATIEFVL